MLKCCTSAGAWAAPRASRGPPRPTWAASCFLSCCRLLAKEQRGLLCPLPLACKQAWAVSAPRTGPRPADRVTGLRTCPACSAAPHAARTWIAPAASWSWSSVSTAPLAAHPPGRAAELRVPIAPVACEHPQVQQLRTCTSACAARASSRCGFVPANK